MSAGGDGDDKSVLFSLPFNYIATRMLHRITFYVVFTSFKFANVKLTIKELNNLTYLTCIFS
jgi:hypothetical protein